MKCKASGTFIFTCHEVLHWGKNGNHSALWLLYFLCAVILSKNDSVLVIETEMKDVMTTTTKSILSIF